MRALIIVSILSLVTLSPALISVAAPPTQDFDAAAVYKAKCAMCHGPAAEKKFDTTKPDAEHVQVVLKGRKAEKPPNMPGYEEKGITEEQAKTLVAFMKSLKK